MWVLIARLVATAVGRFLASGAVRTIGVGIATAEVVDLGILRSDAAKLAGSSDPQALEEAARTAARMLGLDGSHVLWPIRRQTGMHIVPKYFHLDLTRGRAWYTDRYYTRKMTFLARGRGRGRFGSYRSGWRAGSRMLGAGTTNIVER